MPDRDATITRMHTDDPARGGRLQPVPLPAGLAAAAAAGLALLLAFPPYGLWWLAPVGVALLAVGVHRRRARWGAGLGAVTGLVFFAPLLTWTNLEIGNVPWLLLSMLQAGYLVLQGAAAAYLSPMMDRRRWAWPLVTAVLWVAQEALRSRTPFGGFPWGRLAFSQEESPLLPFAVVGGAPLVTFATALVGGLLAVLAWRRWWPLPRCDAAAATRVAASAVAVLFAGTVIPTSTPAGEQVTVAVVQGNVPQLGLDFNAQRRAVLDNHVAATLRLADEVAAGHRPRPELVIWPENSSDIDPTANPDAAARIDEAATAIGVPVLVGAIVRGADGEARNVGLLWHPDGGADGGGTGDSYAKRHPVPFAEYLPLEPVTAPIARAITDAADRVVGFVPGEEPGVLTAGAATFGVVICFEVAYDSLVRDTVTGGGGVLVVQTNNATFNEAEARQQLAMVRLRAVEHGQWAVMASTVGISGFAGPNGEVYDTTGFFTNDVRVRTLTLAERGTVATTVGGWPELLLVAVAASVMMFAAVEALRRRHQTYGEDTDTGAT